MQSDFYIKFWGVRGSIGCSGKEYSRYGGHTPCLQVQCGENCLIFDAGTGIRLLGDLFSSQQDKFNGHLFLSHTHLDHIFGFPFFSPLYNEYNRIKIWAGHLTERGGIKKVICQLMSEPFFPVPVEALKAKLEFYDFRENEVLHPYDQVVVKTVPLNHPGGAMGYRVEFGGRSIGYVTDIEPDEQGNIAENVLDLIKKVDVLVFDGTYFSHEYDKKIGWGHSSWLTAIETAEKAAVGKLILFHHDPSHTDDFLDREFSRLQLDPNRILLAKEKEIIYP